MSKLSTEPTAREEWLKKATPHNNDTNDIRKLLFQYAREWFAANADGRYEKGANLTEKTAQKIEALIDNCTREADLLGRIDELQGWIKSGTPVHEDELNDRIIVLKSKEG